MKPHLHIALAIIWREGKILVTQRRADADHLANFWEFPGGKIGPDEAPATAAVREAREEVGLEIEVVAARAPIEWDYGARRVTPAPLRLPHHRGRTAGSRSRAVALARAKRNRCQPVPARECEAVENAERAVRISALCAESGR